MERQTFIEKVATEILLRVPVMHRRIMSVGSARLNWEHLRCVIPSNMLSYTTGQLESKHTQGVSL